MTFSDLTVKDREALEKYAPAEATTFTAWKIRYTDGTEKMSANVKSYPPFNEIRSKTSATDKREAYNKLRLEDLSMELQPWTNQQVALESMTVWEAKNLDRLSEAPADLQTNFFGFNSNGKMSGLFDFVLVTADLRASEETRDAKASIIGHILERSIDRAAADDEIKKIVEESQARQREVCKEMFGTQLDAIKKQLNEVISSYSSGRSIHVETDEFELKAPRTTFNISVFDGSTATKVEGQGHGFQRTLLISALQVLAQSTAATTEGVFCLAIEEPELFQHPIQAQAFARVLRSLAESPNKRVQVAYATHSPYFIEARHFDQIRRLTRSENDKPQVTIHSSTVDQVKRTLDGIQDPASVDRQLDAITAGELSAALFASKALVVEGTTESAVFYGVGDRNAPAKLESAGVAVVPSNGKSSIPLTHAILSSLGIPCYSVFDADTGFEARAIKTGKCPKKIDDERVSHIAANRKLLKYFELEEEDFPAQTVKDTVAIFGDHLEAFLNLEWPEWNASCAAVEAAAGISFKKNQVAYRNATAKAEGDIPDFLFQILAKLVNI